MRWWWEPPALLRSVVVNLKGEDTAVAGVLWSMRGPWVIIRQPTLVRAGHADATTTDGEVLIHRAQINFIQVVP